MNKFIPQYEPLFAPTVGEELKALVDSGSYLTEFKKTEELERAIEKFLGCKHCIMMPNGTISLSAALQVSGVFGGDIVFVPNISMIATFTAPQFIGCHVELIDVDKDGRMLIPQLERKLIEFEDYPANKAVITVSLNGQRSGLYDVLMKQAKERFGFVWIEDAAQSFGSGSDTGSKFNYWADVVSYSFSMPKIITCGQGGALCTDDPHLASRLRKLKDFGRDAGGCDYHPFFGINLKITDMQAVVLLNQLKDIERRIEFKNNLLDKYRSLVYNGRVGFIDEVFVGNTPWFITFRCNPAINKKKLMAYLKDKGIGTRDFYPPINTQPVANFKNKEVFPGSRDYSSPRFWLPSSFTLTDNDIEYICKTIEEYHE